MKPGKTSFEIMSILLKDLAVKPTVTSLAKEIGISRVGLWKALKRLENDKMVNLTPMGEGKTSIYSITLNWSNPLVEKTLSFALTEEALKKQRWLSNFAELEGKVDFLVIYGSILHSEKEAGDIDLIGVMSKKSFKEVDKILSKIQISQAKKVHAINFTKDEFKSELEKPNKAFIDALKKGIVLFGQDRLIKFLRSITR